MLLKYFYDKELAQASYMVGCAATGEALIIDPARDISPYLQAAQDEGLRIAHVTETHIHADYVSGSRQLAHETGARLYLSDMGDADWKYAYADDNTILLRDGDSWMVGNVKIDVLHTPGHTPEHIVFMITDTATGDQPMGIFTGDFVFVGDVGRPDLLEEAAKIADTKVKGARDQFRSVQRIKELPDYLQIWPGHGAGSACGKALGAVPSTTLGYEKLFNPAFQYDNESAFVDWLLDGQPEPPAYFAQMKVVNKQGPALLQDLPAPQHLSGESLSELLAEGAQVFDMRSTDEYAAGYIPGTLNVPATSDNFSTYLGWFVDFERPAYLIAPDADRAAEIVTSLRAIGVDNLPGFFIADDLLAADTQLPRIDAQELARRAPEVTIIDVRGKSEYEAGHIAGALNIPLGFVPRHLDELPKDAPIVTHCASGYRSQIAASLLLSHGFTNVTNLNDSDAAWRAALNTESAALAQPL
ncbi:MAG: MBL fold metallo-hydrolase [Anaerolineales bacterium]